MRWMTWRGVCGRPRPYRAEEEDGGVLGHRAVAGAGLIDLGLRGVGDLLLLADLVRQHLGRRQDLDGALVLQDVAAQVEFETKL